MNQFLLRGRDHNQIRKLVNRLKGVLPSCIFKFQQADQISISIFKAGEWIYDVTADTPLDIIQKIVQRSLQPTIQVPVNRNKSQIPFSRKVFIRKDSLPNKKFTQFLTKLKVSPPSVKNLPSPPSPMQVSVNFKKRILQHKKVTKKIKAAVKQQQKQQVIQQPIQAQIVQERDDVSSKQQSQQSFQIQTKQIIQVYNFPSTPSYNYSHRNLAICQYEISDIEPKSKRSRQSLLLQTIQEIQQPIVKPSLFKLEPRLPRPQSWQKPACKSGQIVHEFIKDSQQNQHQSFLALKQIKFNQRIFLNQFVDSELIKIWPDYLCNYSDGHHFRIKTHLIQNSDFRFLNCSTTRNAFQFLRVYQPDVLLDIIQSLNQRVRCMVFKFYQCTFVKKYLVDFKISHKILKQSPDKLELWPHLAEKALIKHFNGYQNLKSASPAMLFQAILGGVTFSKRITSITVDVQLKKGLAQDYLIILSLGQKWAMVLQTSKCPQKDSKFLVHLKTQAGIIIMKQSDISRNFDKANFIYFRKRYTRTKLVATHANYLKFAIVVTADTVADSPSPCFLQIIQGTAQQPISLKLYQKCGDEWMIIQKSKGSAYSLFTFNSGAQYLLLGTYQNTGKSPNSNPFVNVPDVQSFELESDQILVSVYSKHKPSLMGQWLDNQGIGTNYIVRSIIDR